jgi:hypothetical protein
VPVRQWAAPARYWIGREHWGRGIATQAPAPDDGIQELIFVLDA